MPMSLRSPTPTPALLTPKSLPMPTPRARSPVPPTRTIKSLPINTSTTLPVVPLQSRRHSTPKIPTLKHRGWGTLATLHPNEVQQWYPLFAWRRQEKTKTSAWATRPKGLERKPQYLEECPFCGVPIVPVWWQRTLHSIVALVITLAIPAYLGLGKGLTLVFPWALLFCIPAMLLAQILVITIIPPKYVRKGQSVTTLFQR